MALNRDFYITYLPVNCSKAHYDILNKAILQALTDIATHGDVSDMSKLNGDNYSNIASLLVPAVRGFYQDTIKMFKRNKALLNVIKNHADIMYFFTNGRGAELVDKLYYEGKIVNWPVLAQSISDPSFNFANSTVMKDYVEEAKRLSNLYSSHNY